MAERKPYRLPQAVIPERYELTLAPDLVHWTFTGEERISVDVREAVREIVVNAAELELHAAALNVSAGKVLQASVRLDAGNEQATLGFDEILAPGRYQLDIKFSGILNDKLHGFYRSTYRDTNGEEKRRASTQFESPRPSRAFPCWDEPAFKAVYQITLIVDENLAAISNARVASETVLPDSRKKKVVFADTIK